MSTTRSRDEMQQMAADRLVLSKRLICQWATGCGKTSIALKFIKERPDTKTLILVPEQNNIQNWLDEFKKFNVPADNAEIACYASFRKYIGTSWDLLVYDEMPHVDTEKRIAICKSVSAKYILALGAVISEDERLSLESVYGKFDKSVISLQTAIAWEMLPIPEVFICHLKLSDTDQKKYDAIQNAVTQAVSDYNLKSSEFNRRKMLRAGNIRKRFLGEKKEQAIRKLCSYLQDQNKRFLCFCSSIKQAEAIGGDKAFTSKSPVSMKHLEKFNNHEIDSLYVVGKLIEGQNLKDIECGIIGQLGGTSRITVQELGRIMRSENPKIYVPVFDCTKDDSFLYTLTSNIPADYIFHYSL